MKQSNYDFLKSLANTCSGMKIVDQCVLKNKSETETEEELLNLIGESGVKATLGIKMTKNVNDDAFSFEISVRGNFNISKTDPSVEPWSIEETNQTLRGGVIDQCFFDETITSLGKVLAFIIVFKTPPNEENTFSAFKYFLDTYDYKKINQENSFPRMDYDWE